MYYKHILLPIDGSELSEKAEKECVAFAKSGAARVTLLHVVSHFQLHYQPWATPRAMHEHIEQQHELEARQNAERKMADVVKGIRGQGVECDGTVVVGDRPYEEIIKAAEQRKCDLIMMASHGHKGLDSVLVGSETMKVLTHSKVPVLVVR